MQLRSSWMSSARRVKASPISRRSITNSGTKPKRPGGGPCLCRSRREGETYVLDLEGAQKHLTGDERVLLWCSPQNPSGRVWTPEELRAVADFAADNELILVSDEVHHDLLYPGASFVPMDIAAPEHRNRLIVATAASKTFNLAGQRTGNLIIPDPDLRAAIAGRLRALDYSPNVPGRPHGDRRL